MDTLQVSRHFTVNVLKDGRNAVRLDLTNEADMVACDANGKVRFARNIVTKVRLYDGATPQSIGKPTVSGSIIYLDSYGTENYLNPTSSPSSGNATEWTFTWAFTTAMTLTATSFNVTISYTYNGVTYSAVLTITRTDSAAIYQLLPSKTDIPFGLNAAGDTWTPTTGIDITCGYTKDTGNGIETHPTLTAYNERIGNLYYVFFRYIGSDGLPVTTGTSNSGGWRWLSPLTINIPNSTNYTAVEFAMSTATSVNGLSSDCITDSNIIDRETIPIVKSGMKGDRGDDGDNAIRVDLENENDSFIYDGSGVNHSAPVTSQARLYDAAQQVSTGITWSIYSYGGVTLMNGGAAIDTTYQQGTYPTAAWIKPNGLVTVNGLTENEGYVIVKAHYQDNDYYEKLTLKRLVNANKYEIVVNPTAIAYNTTTGYPSNTSVTVNIYKTAINSPREKINSVDSEGISLKVYNSSNPPALVTVTHIPNSYDWTFTTSNRSNTSYRVVLVDSTDDTIVHDSETIPITKAANGSQGNPGETGHVGRFYYFAGDYTANTPYRMEKTQCPFVKASNGSFYMLDNAANNPAYEESSTSEGIGTNKNPVSFGSGDPWTLMSSEQQYYIAKAFFGEYAQFGSFIINADWMISTNGNVSGNGGTIDPNVSPYTYFDPIFVGGGRKLIAERLWIKNSTATTLATGLKLRAGKSYTLTLTGKTLGASTTFVVTMTDGSTSKTISKTGTSTETKTITFTVSSDSTWSIRVQRTSGDAYCMIYTLDLKANFPTFTPNFAVDGLTGEVYMNNAHVKGDITAQGLVADDGNFTTEISPGVTTWRSVAYPLEGISIGIDSDGMYIKMTDMNGNAIWQINKDGYRALTNTFGTIYLKKMSNSTPNVNEFCNVTQSDCTQYFTQGGKAYTRAEASSTYKIPEGYYVGINNGSFRQDINTGKYVVLMYHYNSVGALADTTNYEFEM